MICPNCNQEAISIKSVIADKEIKTGCFKCLKNTTQGSEGAAKYKRSRQKEDYRKDLLQPNQPKDFVRAYGADVARENGYTDDQIRKYS